MHTASISASLFASVADIVADIGLAGVFVLMVLEAACIPIPSEATMVFAGFSVHQGSYGLLAAVVVGVAGNLVGSWIAFGAGRLGREWIVRRRADQQLGRHLGRADRWFERYGTASVLVARVVPVVRTFISLPAGASEMSFSRFSWLTVLGCVPWVLALVLLGDALGSNWSSVQRWSSYADYAVVALVVIGALALVIRSRRRSAVAS